MLCTEHQGEDCQNTATGSHVQKLSFRSNEFPQLSHTQLGRLMHSCSKCSSWIDMNDHLILILRLDILPGRNYKDIINIKLVKILLTEKRYDDAEKASEDAEYREKLMKEYKLVG